MQAIRTRYYGPSDTRGTRITAKCEGGSLTIPRNYSLDVEQDHARAAQKLAERLGWDGVYHGGSFGGDYYWTRESGWISPVVVTSATEAA